MFGAKDNSLRSTLDLSGNYDFIDLSSSFVTLFMNDLASSINYYWFLIEQSKERASNSLCLALYSHRRMSKKRKVRRTKIVVKRTMLTV